MDQELGSYSELIKSKINCTCEPDRAEPHRNQIRATTQRNGAKHSLIVERGLTPQILTARVDAWIQGLPGGDF